MDVASLHSPLDRRAIETINEGPAPFSLPFGEA